MNLFIAGSFLDVLYVVYGTYWESLYTTIANCNEKTMRVRFYEDDSNVINIGFEK